MGLGGPQEILEDNTTIAITDSLWALDATRTSLGELLCTAAGSGSTLLRGAEDLRFDLDQATVLGTCPGGEPVEGQIEFCMGFACGFDDAVTGSIDGTAWASRRDGYQSGEPYRVTFVDDSMLLFMTNGSALGTWGLLVTTPESPYAGAVYCVGSASLTGQTQWTFGSFSNLGTCAGGGAKTITGCARPAKFL